MAMHLPLSDRRIRAPGHPRPWALPLLSLVCAALLAACGTAPSREAAAPPVVPTLPARAPTPGATTPSIPVVASAPVDEAATPQLPATVTDFTGSSVTVTSVERIVSLTGDVTEILFALGLGDAVVGVDSSATYPPERTRALPNIGYQRRLSSEGILALNPTLVIGDEAAGPPEALDQIRSAGVPVVLASDPPTLAAPAAKIRFVATALGIPARGEALATQVEAEIAAAQAAAVRLADPPQVLFLYLRGTDVQQVAGSETPADAMIVAAGGVNVAATAGIVGFKPLSPETVIAAQPEVILVLAKGLESVGGVDGLLRIPGLADTPAGQQRRVVALDDLYLLGMGPRTGQALAELVAAFQNDTTAGGRP
jgi:iron complex transport system substrate-binding protein